jgi:FkbM family methyltransferase
VTLPIDALADLFGADIIRPEDVRALATSPRHAASILREACARSLVLSDRRSWQRILGKWVLFLHASQVWFWLRLGDSPSLAIIQADNDDRALKFILSRLTSGGAFFDLGANVGWFTLRVAQAYKALGQGQVFAYEPQHEICTYLQRSVLENQFQDYVQVFPVALGATTGQIWMRQPGTNSGGSFVLFARRTGVSKESVQMRRFDDIAPEVSRVDCMKVDIEGAEPLFIAGAMDFIARHRPIIYSEVHHTRLPLIANVDRAGYIDQVERLGYRTLVLRSDGSTGPFCRDSLADERTLLNVVFEPLS